MNENKPVLVVNLILIIIEIIALIHDIYAFGSKLFEWYTIDSNVLQLVISGLIIYYLLKKTVIPDYVTILHFISAVGLTVTFLIAAFVLAPEGGIRYYFIENVASINHLIAPALSVVSLLFLEKIEEKQLDNRPVSCGSNPGLWVYLSYTECYEHTGWTVLLFTG